MNSKQHIKKELMVYAISHDYFGYGSQCYQRKDGKWICIVDAERGEYTGEQLAEQFDQLDNSEKANIIHDYMEAELHVVMSDPETSTK